MFDAKLQEAIANTIANTIAKAIQPTEKSDKLHPEEFTHQVVRSIAIDLARYFSVENTSFNRRAFYKACGL